MVLFELLNIWHPPFSAKRAKVHLARYNGSEEPLDVFIQGNFDEWQCWQSARNFEREYVVSLIQAGAYTRWLFAGLYRKINCTRETEPRPHYRYDLQRLQSAEEWVGRLYLTSRYKARNSYPLGETLEDDLAVSELLAERLSIGQFPGYKNVKLTKGQLDVLVGLQAESWRVALSSVKGVYLITDQSNGKLYVGKADGENGIWGRWCTYSATGHGHNVALKQELGVNVPAERQNDFRFSVLEIADLHTTEQDIQDREDHWKDVLMTRKYGYNLN